MKILTLKLLASIHLSLLLLFIASDSALAQITNPAIGEWGTVDRQEQSVGILQDIALAVISRIMPIALILLFLYIIWGAFDWITSGGDSGKVSSARNKIVQGIIGVIVLSALFAIMMIIQTFLHLEFLNIIFPSFFG